MSALTDAVEDYLCLRRALGYKLADHGRLLHGFAEYVNDRGSEHVTVELAVKWATLPKGVQPVWWHQRLGIVRGFAAHQATIDPRTEIPPKDLLVRPTGRRTPYLFSAGEVVSLMDAAARLRYPLKAATYQTLVGLLASTGMRVGEAIRLDRVDVELNSEVVTVWRSKFGKSRRLPLHESTTQALVSYTRRRDQLCPHPRTDSFFVSLRGTRLDHSVVDAVFRSLIQTTGIDRTAHRHPRAHDLRHSFAVGCLLRWYREGVDPQDRLLRLSTFMGHVSPVSTAVYLTITPALLGEASRRFEAFAPTEAVVA